MDPKKAQNTAQSTRRVAILFTLMTLVVAVVFAWLLAVMLGRTFSSEELFPVVVAATKVSPMSILEERQLQLAQVPQSALPDDCYSSVQQVLEEPRLTVAGLVTGEPLIASRLASPERGIGMALAVPPQMRAFAVKVTEAIATAQMLRPGVFVDVVATFQDPATRLKVTKLVLQNVEVLAVGRDLVLSDRKQQDSKSADGESKEDKVRRIVTLLVTPHDVEYLAHVSKGNSTLDLALRSGEDEEVVKTYGVSVRDIIGMAPVSSSPKPKTTSTVEARRPRSRTRVSPLDRARARQPTIIRVKK